MKNGDLIEITASQKGNKKTRYPDGLAVELYFDPDSERQIRAFRESLYQQGIKPVLGLLNDKPHISLAVFSSMDPTGLTTLSHEFAKPLTTFDFQLGAVGVFPTLDNVLFLYPVPSQKLLEIHHSFHQLLHLHNIESSMYYHPGNWVPHCTIEFNISDADLRKAISLSKRVFAPIKGRITQLGVVAFRPIEYLTHFDLKEI